MTTNLQCALLGALGAMILTLPLGAGPNSAGSSSARKSAEASGVVVTANSDTMRVEGEKRFHANCGRCHATPEKFPPRMMATVLRHMRVRATVTNADQRLILFYMTQ
jgi:cytochrome c5